MEHLQSVDFSAVTLNSGFWQERQALNHSATIYAIWRRFQETGRFAAFRFDWKPGDPHKPHIFYDSDVAKWIEAAAYILQKEEDPRLEGMIDETVEQIAAHQGADGYFNVWFTVVEPEKRFQERTAHELYCAGHLMEAAVAYHNARGKDLFLQCMCRYADYIEKIFKTEQSAGFVTPGHEEIELALVKLYRCTGESRYLELSRWFLDQRGNNAKDTEAEWCSPLYSQSHLPVREQTTAEGHAVRAAYLYCGMADEAYEYGDDAMFRACRALFRNITDKRMYITGGIGSSSSGEAFTKDYDLPNETAYTESCAAIGLALFARRMLRLESDSLYADTAELALYNGYLASISLDGTRFFYENPLEINLLHHGRNPSVKQEEHLPITQRVEVFDCSCCPPNIARLAASVGDFLYTHDDSRLFVHQYMDSTAAWESGSRRIRMTQSTQYPADGRIQFRLEGAAGMTLGVRIPGWCHSFRLMTEQGSAAHRLVKGYALIDVPNDRFELLLDLTMEPELVESRPEAFDNTGRAALRRGPVIYCLEGVDNGPLLQDLRVSAALHARLSPHPSAPLPLIHASGWRRTVEPAAPLYQPYSPQFSPCELTFIPYYTFANRGESDMRVWIPVAETPGRS